MPDQHKMDTLYIDLASRCALESHAKRAKVGALVVKGTNIIAHGWNGMPSGMPNDCEIVNGDGTLTTKPELIHAEDNTVRKLKAANTHGQLDGATFYTTMSPCSNCADIIIQSKISRIVYRDAYRDLSGIEKCRKAGITVEQYQAFPISKLTGGFR